MKDQTEHEASNDANDTATPPQDQSPATVGQAQQETNPQSANAGDESEQTGEGTGARAGEYR